MKYEAKIQGISDGNQTYSSSYVPESRASGTPWVNISQTNAITECASLGSGYHLITNAEWTSLARHIAAQSSNWSNNAVGSGVLSRGYSASTTYASDGFYNTAPAPTTGASNDLYNTGANAVGSSGLFDLKRTHNTANGGVLWDLAGNVWEWNTGSCQKGNGEGYWYDSGVWIEWVDGNLNDYERPTFGHSDQTYSSEKNIGKYLGCTNTGNIFLVGGGWPHGTLSGLFALSLMNTNLLTYNYVGFRCSK
jgi:hypothetical protein